MMHFLIPAMKNKYFFLLTLVMTSLIMAQCKSTKYVEPEVAAKIDFDKGAVQIMDTLVARLYGSWNLQQVEFDIKYPNPIGSVKRDTVFTDFAVLEIQNISRTEDSRYPMCKGQIRFRDQLWPVAFRLLAAPERIVEGKGPQAFTLLDWQFPTGTHVWAPEELFFRDLGLAGENYSIELQKDGTMVWKGLNRDISRINMKRI
jgi:hypothetical protein